MYRGTNNCKGACFTLNLVKFRLSAKFSAPSGFNACAAINKDELVHGTVAKDVTAASLQ
jgi:hypothetical protein